MGFLNKAKAAAGQAAARAKEMGEDAKEKWDLTQAYNELGKTAFELIESGEISHARLEGPAEKIRSLKEDDEAESEVPVAEEVVPPPSTPPPS